MLRITEVALEAVRGIGRILPAIGRVDRELEDQLRRAASSFVLNLEEGAGNRGANRKQRFFTAAGSVREARAAVLVAVALGYVEAESVAARACKPFCALDVRGRAHGERQDPRGAVGRASRRRTDARGTV